MVTDHPGAARRVVQIVSGNAENLNLRNLICALEQAGVQLIDAPLTVELTPEVQAELERAT
jgi:hypothetical protein